MVLKPDISLLMLWDKQTPDLTNKVILEYFKIPYVEHSYKYMMSGYPTWDGEKLYFKNSVNSKDFGWIIHEISHMIIAPKESFRKHNYGLGTDPGGGSKSDETGPYLVSIIDDETIACFLDIFILEKLGLESEIIKHLDEYNVYLNSGELKMIETAMLLHGFPSEIIMDTYKKYVPFPLDIDIKS